MITEEIIEEFFDAIDEAELDHVKDLLDANPELVRSQYDDLMPYQAAENTYYSFKKRSDDMPESIARQKLTQISEEIKALIHEKTVLFAIDRQDIELLDHAEENGASPFGTFVNGIDTYQYAIENRKTLVVEWFTKDMNEAKERYKGHAELSDLLDRKAITENARDEAIINQSSATMSRLAINS